MFKFLIKSVAGSILALGMGIAQAQSYDYLLLAASWEPGFCATHGTTQECSALHGTYAAGNMSLHGLWPNSYDGNHPYYCNAPQRDIDLDQSHAWCSMDQYGISAASLKTLTTYMPGVASCLDKHEWFKHGTCAHAASPSAYWDEASELVRRLGGTSFNGFLRNHAGNTVTRSQLLAAFDGSFGSNARTAVSLKCTKANGITYLTEVWIAVNEAALSQFPGNAALVTDGNIQSTCPSAGIYIARS